MKKGLVIALVLLLVCGIAIGVYFVSQSTDSPEQCEHLWDNGILVNENECGKGALIRISCLNCGEYKEEILLDHKLVKTNIVTPSCTSIGYVAYRCSLCNSTYLSDFVNAYGHNYDKDIVVRKATCTESGTYKKVCANCNEVYNYSKNATGHSYILISDDETSSTYECKHCLTTVAVNDGETLEEFVGSDELFDVLPTFTFDIFSSQGETFIRQNLVILDSYFNNSEYENSHGVIKEYTIASKGNNVWTVTAVSNYDYDTTYIAKLQNGLAFADHKGETLTFTVTEDPNHENTYEYTGDIVFLQALENESPGYYPYNIVLSDESEYLYLTLNKIDGLEKGMIICIGNITSQEQLESGTEYYFGKIGDFYPLTDGSWMIAMSAPDITEVFEELDIAYNGTIDFSEADIDIEQLKAELTDSLFSNEDFIKFLSVVNVSANQYFTDNNYSTEELADTKSFMDKIELNPDFKIGDDKKSIIASVNGSLKVPIKSGKEEIGSFNVAFTVGLKSKFELDVDYKIKNQFLQIPKIEKFDIRVTQTDTFDFNFNVSIDIHKSFEEEPYVQNIESGKIHRRGCVHLSSVKDYSKLKGLSAETAEQYLSETPSLGCKHCQPITGFNSDLLVLNTKSKVIHAYGCNTLTNISEQNKKLSSEKSSYWMAQGYTCCDWCHPDNREEVEYQAIYVKTLQYGNWQQVATDMTQWAKDSGIAEKSKKGVTITKIDFPICGPVVITLELDIVITLDIEATFEYVYSYEQVNIYGIRKENDDMKPYCNNVSKTTLENHCSVMGKIEVRAGLVVDVSINILGFSKYVSAGVTAEIGAYAEISGILSWSGTEDSSYMAAYFAVGIYLDVNANYKILWWEDDLGFEQKFPLLTLGYERAYFGYETYHDELIITNSFDIAGEDLLKVKYFDLITMTTKTDELSLSETQKYKINITFLNGNCKIQNGRIVPQSGAPKEFTDTMIITVTSDAKWDNFKKGTYVYYLGTYEIGITFNNENFQNLEFDINDDGKSYSVTGIGACTDTNLVIPATYNNKPITTIGKEAFAYCDTLTSITIPNSVTTISEEAFAYCEALTSVTIPDSVTTIGEEAFSGCDRLTSITIPDSVITIGSGAFAYCEALTSVTIPDSVTTIGDYAFEGCSNLTIIIVDENNKVYQSIDGNLYTKDGTVLVTYAIGKANTSFVIPDSVTTIGNAAFSSCSNLTSITIGDSITIISDDAFYGCDRLTSITIPDTVITIGNFAFAYCDNLMNVTIGDSVTTIGNFAFAYCDNLMNVTIGDSVTTIGNYAFAYCTNLTSITIPDFVTTIGDYAFYTCNNLINVTIGDSVTSIGYRAFSVCSNLMSVTIPGFVTIIGEDAFWNCTNLTSITFEGTKAQWQTIKKGNNWNRDTGKYTIYCSDAAIFKDDMGMANNSSQGLEFKLNDDGESYSVTSIGSCTDTNLIIPTTYNDKPVTAIEKQAFIRCYKLESVTIPDSIIAIGDYAFCDCSGLMNITIGNSVVSIGIASFYGCSNITTLIVPDSVTTIGEGAFGYCTNLTNVTLGNSLTSISQSMFVKCSNLANIIIPNSVTTINDWAFGYCTNLTSVTIGESVTTIGKRVFRLCSNLTSIIVSENNKFYQSIDGNLYSKNGTKLVTYAIGKTDTNFTIPKSVIFIENEAFYGCSNLMNVTIGDSVNSIGYYAFQDCSNLTNVTIGKSVTAIYTHAFGGCSSLISITFDNTKAQWNIIYKSSSIWDSNTGNYTIYCTDGTISK